MKKSAINSMPKYFDRYINLIEDIETDQAFQNSLDELDAFDWEKCQKVGLSTYAPEKWTILDILQHLLDWERIMTYRALMFAREAIKTAPGHDEDFLAKTANANARSLADLVEEMKILRQSTRLIFKHMSDAQLQQSGLCWQSEMSALALAFTILGHQRHHFKVIEERYFALLV